MAKVNLPVRPSHSSDIEGNNRLDRGEELDGAEFCEASQVTPVSVFCFIFVVTEGCNYGDLL
jgi:hypothetical protein